MVKIDYSTVIVGAKLERIAFGGDPLPAQEKLCLLNLVRFKLWGNDEDYMRYQAESCVRKGCISSDAYDKYYHHIGNISFSISIYICKR